MPSFLRSRAVITLISLPTRSVSKSPRAALADAGCGARSGWLGSDFLDCFLDGHFVFGLSHGVPTIELYLVAL
jgi:hypothetical protein